MDQQTIDYPRPDGGSARGVLTGPVGAPGIVVIQEWWGVNAQIKGVAARLAAAGYRVLVPDLYRGQLGVDAEEASHLMQGLDFTDAASQDIRGAVQHLKASGSAKVGVTGFCMGGALTVLSACMAPEADAFCIWYGYPPLGFVDVGKVHAPLMGHWATRDDFFAIAGVDALEHSLRAAGVGFEFFRYDAKHAFANEDADSKHLDALAYDPASAALAWERTERFFARHLRQ
ncbi:MAG: dienelactone hydrolase family protein [Rhodocyclaceae bacterium]|nr:dienelactone hydrolase family protein [Rhodocyclaceae bacterium]